MLTYASYSSQYPLSMHVTVSIVCCSCRVDKTSKLKAVMLITVIKQILTPVQFHDVETHGN